MHKIKLSFNGTGTVAELTEFFALLMQKALIVNYEIPTIFLVNEHPDCPEMKGQVTWAKEASMDAVEYFTKHYLEDAINSRGDAYVAPQSKPKNVGNPFDGLFDDIATITKNTNALLYGNLRSDSESAFKSSAAQGQPKISIVDNPGNSHTGTAPSISVPPIEGERVKLDSHIKPE